MNSKTKSSKSRRTKLFAGLVEISVPIDINGLMKPNKEKILKNGR